MSVQIHPTTAVDPKAEIGEDVEVGPFCVVGPQARLGDRTRLISHVSIMGRTSLGPDCLIYPFTALGGAPQDFKHKDDDDTALIIGARNVMREHVTMHVGTAAGRGETRVGDGGYFMVGAHVAHDCRVGDNVWFANNGTLGGHVDIGDYVIIGGLAAVHQHGRVGRHAFIGAMATLTTDVIPYGFVVGNHAHLAGLNVVGLKRRGFTREGIHDLRAAYRLLFAEEGTFQERVEDVARIFEGNAEVAEIIEFIRTPSNRALCMPETR